jgi:hypothetical protein
MLKELNSAFLIRIAKYKTVDELRIVIKAQNDLALQHVDAKSIVLWKVSELWWCVLMMGSRSKSVEEI